MPETEPWQASLLEQRIAWGIAACCIILVFLASTRPEWFELPTPPPQPIVKKEPIRNTPRPAPVIHHHRVETPVEAPVKIQPAQPEPKKRPVVTTPKTKAPDTRVIASGFYVQIGAFHERLRAQGLADQLKRKGWKAVISTRKNSLFAVWIGPKQTRASAEKLLVTIQHKLKSKGFIVHQKSG